MINTFQKWLTLPLLTFLVLPGCASVWKPKTAEIGEYSARPPALLHRRHLSASRESSRPTFAPQPTDPFTPAAMPQAEGLTGVRADYGRIPPQVRANSPDFSDDSGDLYPESIDPAFLSSSTPESGIVRVSWEKPAEVNAVGIVRTSASARSSVSTFRAAEPRMPTPQNCGPEMSSVVVGASPFSQAYPDEYIFDGGDRDLPVHYFAGAMAGLETEDTVAEFKDHTGKNHLQASNRVAIYAPRFGAVETVTGPGIDIKVDRAAGATDISGPGGLHEQRGMESRVVATVVSGLDARNSASGIEIAQSPIGSQNSQSVVLNTKVDPGMEARSTNGLGILQRSSIQELHIQILEPNTSNIQTGIAKSVAMSQATVTYSTFRVQATVGVEDTKTRRGQIFITKKASPLIAKPGDVVIFHIHFRNTGDLNVHDVRIVDNLTPRLKYVDGSGKIELANGRAGGLTVTPNDEGSEVLEFALDEPLRGGESGNITFEALVR